MQWISLMLNKSTERDKEPVHHAGESVLVEEGIGIKRCHFFVSLTPYKKEFNPFAERGISFAPDSEKQRPIMFNENNEPAPLMTSVEPVGLPEVLSNQLIATINYRQVMHESLFDLFDKKPTKPPVESKEPDGSNTVELALDSYHYGILERGHDRDAVAHKMLTLIALKGFFKRRQVAKSAERDSTEPVVINSGPSR